jgi:hypothetical protein
MSTLPSYGKIYAIGHRASHRLFDGPVVIQEKVDGSQFTFGCKEGKLFMRSKGAEIYDSESAPDLFKAACRHVESLHDRDMLSNGWVYRGEVLKAPKHNVLCYERAPRNHIVLFDVDTNGMQNYTDKPGVLRSHADFLEVDCIPELYRGVVESQALLDELKGITSFLGGQQIEGFVVKNYSQFTADGKTMMGKWVSERFKEVHRKDYKAYGKSNKVDIVERIKQQFGTEARWRKSIIHLEEAGKLTNSPKDIGPLLNEIKRDVMSECHEEIRDMLMKEYQKHIERAITSGFPEWYKKQVEADVFGGEE